MDLNQARNFGLFLWYQVGRHPANLLKISSYIHFQASLYIHSLYLGSLLLEAEYLYYVIEMH
jgi:hypothetical protein